jgi:hypothetical protein
MATTKKSGNAPVAKVSFGQRRKGKAQKSYGPKDSKPKQYKGQGK